MDEISETVQKHLDTSRQCLEQAEAIRKEYENVDLPEAKASEIDSLLIKSQEERAAAEREQAFENLGTFHRQPIRKHPIGMAAPAGVQIEVGHDRAEDRPFKCFGEQLHAVQMAAQGGPRDIRLKAPTGLGETQPADGGFLVQTDFAAELMRRVHETAILPSRCTEIPISSRANRVKINAVSETSRANGSRWGGIQAYWTDEAAEMASSKPKFREIELSLSKLTGVCYATDELLEDAMALEAVISQGFQEEFGFKLDDSIINGDGSGKPSGILQSSCLVTVAKESGQTAQSVVAENIIKMRARLWARSRVNSVWLINQDIEPELHTMNLPVGTGGVPVYLPANGLSGLPYDTLYGRPIIPIEQCSTLGTLGDIILGDFSQYLLATKGGMKSDVSIHVRFIYDETTFRFVMRVDGQPSWNSPLTPYRGTNTLSPFVVLETRA